MKRQVLRIMLGVALFSLGGSEMRALGETVKFTIDGNKFFRNGELFWSLGGGGGGGRGFDIAVIDPESGQLREPVHNFDTWGQGTAALQSMIDFLDGLPNGVLLLIAIVDEVGAGKSEEGFRAMEKLGSQLIRQIGFRYEFEMITIKGEGQAFREWISSVGWHQAGFVVVPIEATFDFPLPSFVPELHAARTHLAEQMDRFHQSSDVYTDVGAGGNQFVMLGKIGTDLGAVDIDPCAVESPHSGATAVRNSFRNTTGQNWGGWYFRN